MDFELTDEQQHLRDSVRSMLEREASPAVLRSAYEGSQTEVAGGLWKKMVELDWPALAVPEALGGLGLGFVELGLVAEEIGGAAAPSPFLSTVTQFVPAVLECAEPEQQKALLDPIVGGATTGTLAVAERGAGWDTRRLGTTARKEGGGWVLDGAKTFVMDGATAGCIAVVARDDGGRIGVFALGENARSSIEALAPDVIDPSQPLAELRFPSVRVPGDGVLIEPGDPRAGEAVGRLMEQATAAMALSTTGTCRAVFESTLQYVKDREQFGRPIGSFQAVKHRLVDMFLAVEKASSLAYFAALTIAEEDPGRTLAVSMAKAAAGDCQRLVVGEGLQLHGGVGYIWEQDVHLFLKRAKSSDFLFGTAAEHRADVAATLGLVA